MVMLTFDDAVNYNNWHYYQGLFPTAERDALRNPNGCRTTATFFLADPNDTVMTMVKTLADKGNEMGSHSQTHSAPAAWSRQDWDIQMQGMRQRVAVATGIPQDKIVGMRAPFLQLGGEEQFSVLQERGFLYDSSMFGGGGNVHNTHTPPLWPFTLHFPPTPSRQVCDQERCPQRSYPRLWEVPITEQFTSTGRACTMTDGCLGHDASVDDVVNFLRHNFNRHYLNNKAPFMISLHATWFDDVPNSYAGLKEFLREISLRRDVWQVTLTQMLDWVRHPVPFSRANEIPSWRCSK
ncbi:chitin deacetylase 1-like isoform X2 [Littorina saxatilis]